MKDIKKTKNLIFKFFVFFLFEYIYYLVKSYLEHRYGFLFFYYRIFFIVFINL